MTDKTSIKENIENMKRCPRFQNCDIPKCPLDYLIGERIELLDDKKCVLLKLLGKNKSKRMKGNISPKMRGLASFIHKNN